MGIFHAHIAVVNRTCRSLNVRFDGQDIELEPNYTDSGERIEGVVNTIPEQAIPYALAQNPVMGSEHPQNPSDFRSLIGVVKRKGETANYTWHDCSFFDEKAWLKEHGINAMSRVAIREYLDDDPQVKDVVVRGRRTDVEAMPTTPFDVRVRS